MTFPTLKQIEEYNNFQQTWYQRFGQFQPGKKIPNIREYFQRKGGIPMVKKKKKKKSKKDLKIKKA
tara:strand:- start:265 stop:462 length:198 start_codon:yes stop_codon:yes gene_type:complete